MRKRNKAYLALLNACRLNHECVFVFCLFAASCLEKTKDNHYHTTSYGEVKTISIAIDNEDQSKIGFVKLENDVFIGITSLCVVDHFVFLTDELHKNVKRVDLRSSEVIHSERLTDSTFFKQFNDATWFNERLYISSSERAVFVVSRDLKEHTSFELPTKGGYPTIVFGKTDSTVDFVVETRDSLYKVDKGNNVIARRKLFEDEQSLVTNFFNLEQGHVGYKKLKYIKSDSLECLIINERRIDLVRPYQYSPDARNVDFNENYCVIFEIDESYLRLYVYALIL